MIYDHNNGHKRNAITHIYEFMVIESHTIRVKYNNNLMLYMYMFISNHKPVCNFF